MIYLSVLLPIVMIPLGGALGVWLAFRQSKRRGTLKSVDEMEVMRKLSEQIESSRQ